MWRCPHCGEQNEDQFDSCWKCAKTGPNGDSESAPPGTSAWFFRYWRRGWAILLLTVLIGLCAHFAEAVISATQAHGIEVRLLAGVLVVMALPVAAYLVFTLLFGEEAWTWGKPSRTPSREETATALLEEGTRLEARGNPEAALQAYAEIMQDYAETSAAPQARKSVENLRAQSHE